MNIGLFNFFFAKMPKEHLPETQKKKRQLIIRWFTVKIFTHPLVFFFFLRGQNNIFTPHPLHPSIHQ